MPLDRGFRFRDVRGECACHCLAIDMILSLEVQWRRHLAIGVQGCVSVVDAVVGYLNGSLSEPTGAGSAVFWDRLGALADESTAAADNMSQPILFVAGELDYNVPLNESEAWATYLSSIGKSYERVTLPCISHAFNCINESNYTLMTEANYGRHVAPEVVDVLTKFVRNVTAASSSTPSPSPTGMGEPTAPRTSGVAQSWNRGS